MKVEKPGSLLCLLFTFPVVQSDKRLVSSDGAFVSCFFLFMFFYLQRDVRLQIKLSTVKKYFKPYADYFIFLSNLASVIFFLSLTD